MPQCISAKWRSHVGWAIASIVSAFAAVIPTVAYTVAFYWADRYEREPRSLLLTAFLWGAIPAVILSLISEIALGSPFVIDSTSLAAVLVEGVIVAPIVEEIAKAVALLGLFLWKRNEFDGVLDGLIYGALVGFGFAMTENFVYFLGAYNEGGFTSLTFVIVLRAIIFGLNHAFYTSLTGMGFGMARNARKSLVKVLWALLGLSAAITVHALHNLGVLISGVNPLGFVLSLFIAVCGLGLVFVAVILSWNHERSVIRVELSEELGNIISAEDLLTLTGRWRQPLRSKDDEVADRMALYVELAIRKRRLRIFGADDNANSLSEIEGIRNQLRDAQIGLEVDSSPMIDDLA